MAIPIGGCGHKGQPPCPPVDCGTGYSVEDMAAHGTAAFAAGYRHCMETLAETSVASDIAIKVRTEYQRITDSLV